VHKNSRPALSLWTREGKKIPTKGAGWSGVMTFQQKFMDITPNDELYVRPGTSGKVAWPAGGSGGVTLFDMDLQPKRTVIWQCSDGCVVKTDLKGNIYLGENVRPLKRLIPEFFDGKLKPVKSQGIGGTDWYSYMYASIVKFSPKGGAVWFDRKAAAKAPAQIQAMPKQPFNFRTRHRGPRPPGDLQGAQWVRFGFAPYASTYGGGTPRCQCEGSGFDVDGFGRVFYPSLGRFRVEVIDNNNNLIGTFGKYGNADSQLVPTGSKDGKPLIAVPEIPLCWPTYVAAGDNYAYVGDVVGMRTVKVKLAYAAEATCPAAGGSASMARPSARTAVLKRSDNSDTSDPSDRSARSEISKAARPAAKHPIQNPRSKIQNRKGRSPEQICTGWFSAARNYRKVGMKKDARRCLKNIISKYPDSEWAARARGELAGM
jgi:hypothetical protein